MNEQLRVLVADDNRIARAAVTAQLDRWGIAYSVAGDGEEAWRLLQGVAAPRIAILDWSMPRADGLEVCRRVRASSNEHYTYLILLTAHEGEEAIAAGFAAGADDYLFKGSPAHALRTRLLVASRIAAMQEELLRAREILRTEARHDALTGLRNRRAGEEALQRELSRAARGDRSFSVLLCDLDCFKCINDTLGHHAGDQVLIETAALMQHIIRAEDVVVRWGGEEFLVLLPDIGLEGAERAAERLRLAIMNNTIVIEGRALQVTASFGVAGVPKGGRPLRVLLQAADEALYRAKEASRNCVRVEQPREEDGVVETRMSLVNALRQAEEHREGSGCATAELTA